MRTLVVYYSRTGTTRTVATALERELGADVEEISEERPRAGLRGYLRAAWDSLLGRTASIAPLRHDPSDYDLVVIGTPVWNADAATPVRQYLAMNRHRIQRAAFFCTYGGTGSARALRRMHAITGLAPAITLAIRAEEARRSGIGPKIHRFASALEIVAPRMSLPPPFGPSVLAT